MNTAALKSTRLTLLLSAVVAIILSACSTSAPEIELSTAALGNVPIVTDHLGLAQGLEKTGFDTVVSEPKNLRETFEKVQGGLVSYTPLPDEIWPQPFPWPFPWPWPCNPTHCDPAFDSSIGWDFTGAYMTPKFTETLQTYGLEPSEVAQFSGPQISDLLVKLEIKIYIIRVVCNGLTGECVRIRVPIELDDPEIICPVCGITTDFSDIRNGELVKDFSGADIVISNSAGLGDLEAQVGDLVQLQGKGLEPAIHTAKLALHPKVGEAQGAALAESLLSVDAQLSLYKQAGILPTVPEAMKEVATGSFAEHLEGALEHGVQVSEDPLPVFFGRAAKP